MAVTPSIQRVRSIFNTDRGGSYANEFEVRFTFDSVANAGLISDLSAAGFNVNSASTGAYANMMLLCDEASLPGTFSATSEIDGLYTGRLINYPQAKLYNDISLSFIMTNKMHPAKFFDIWMYYMFPEFELNTANIIPYDQKAKRTSRTNIVGINYYDRSVCNQIEVRKIYKTQFAPNGGLSARYQVLKAYPYTIESVPLAYGPSTLNKLRVQFRYEKYVANF